MAGMAPANVPAGTSSDNGKGINYTPALAVLTSLFFMWGFLTCLNDIIIPHLKAVFELNYFRAMLVQFCFFAAYFIMSVPSGMLVERIGYKNGIIVGLFTAAVGCVMFYPAAGMRSYNVFLFAFFVLASGITLLQVAANPYVTILGKPETASSRLTLTQAFNSMATFVAPFFGAAFILSKQVKSSAEIAAMSTAELSAYRASEASSVQVPYLGLAAALGVVAVLIALSRLPRIEAASGASAEEGGSNHDHLHDSAWKYRHLVLGAVAIFLYVGGEVTIGSFLINYFKELQIPGITEVAAANFVSMYWGGAMVGRFAGALIMRYVNPGRVLMFNAIVVIALVLVSMFSKGHVAMFSILAVGLFNSIMFPTIFALAVKGLGKHTGQGSGILCAAIVGGAIVPLVQGFFADRMGVQLAFFIPVICYAYIAFYGFKGHIPAFEKQAAE